MPSKSNGSNGASVIDDSGRGPDVLRRRGPSLRSSALQFGKFIMSFSINIDIYNCLPPILSLVVRQRGEYHERYFVRDQHNTIVFEIMIFEILIVRHNNLHFFGIGYLYITTWAT